MGDLKKNYCSGETLSNTKYKRKKSEKFKNIGIKHFLRKEKVPCCYSKGPVLFRTLVPSEVDRKNLLAQLQTTIPQKHFPNCL